MKKILPIILISFVCLLSSCEGFFETRPIYSSTSDNYYRTPEEVQSALAGVYAALYADSQLNDEHLVSTLLSDVVFAGGGTDDAAAKHLAEFVDPQENTHEGLWKNTYKGISRVNAIIEQVAKNNYSAHFVSSTEAETFKNSMLGEAYFMRGFLMFRAARLFGGMPVITSSAGPFDGPRATFAETFGQIAADFLAATTYLPEISSAAIPVTEYGHANLWIAKAYLARTYMFATGYISNIEGQATTALAMPDGNSLTADVVVGHLEDIMNKGGYELTPDFRNLWPYANINKVAGSEILPWAADNNLVWAGQDGPNGTLHGTGNKEVMFALRYSNAEAWGDEKYRNWTVLFTGIRKHQLKPFGEGWGWGTIHPVFFNNWSDDDVRKLGSVIEVGKADQGTESYVGGQGDHETGLFNKKYTPLQFTKDGSDMGMFQEMYGNSEASYMLWHAQDFYYLRYADVLLMHSELTSTNNGLNQVRNRAGLANVPYSIEALKEERLHEFLYEGIRWFDLVRWGDITKSGNGVYFGVEANVVNEGGVAGTYKEVYKEDTKGLRPVPESEIALANGVYEQNPGW